MLKKIRENKGFTLAELLVVVAIIGILVAVSIPIFTAQLRKARLATNQANARAAYASATSSYLGGDVAKGGVLVYTTGTGTGAWTPTASTAAAGNISISGWTVDTANGTGSTAIKYGDTVFKTWTVTLNDSGEVVTIIGS